MDEFVKRQFAIWAEERGLPVDEGNKCIAKMTPYGCDGDMWRAWFGNRHGGIAPDCWVPQFDCKINGEVELDSGTVYRTNWSLRTLQIVDAPLLTFRFTLEVSTFVVAKYGIIARLSGRSVSNWNGNECECCIKSVKPPKHGMQSWKYYTLLPVHSSQQTTPFAAIIYPYNTTGVSKQITFDLNGRNIYGPVIAETYCMTDLSVEGLHKAADHMKSIAMQQTKSIKKECERAMIKMCAERELKNG